MRAAVITFPGSNRERDMVLALRRVAGRAPEIVWHGESELPDVDLIVLPGGFAYGDYLRAGAMAARSPVMAEVVRRADRGVPVLAVCNGFQVLTEAGLLPGALLPNAGLTFVCRHVHLRVETSQTVFTNRLAQGQIIRVPVAHHDGNYFADSDTLAELQDQDRIAFRYCDAEGGLSAAANPNGSIGHIAGIFNRSRTVLGMMPHPEDATDPALGNKDALPLFEGLVAALA